MPKLSVIVPVYNEEKTIIQILNKILSINIDKEVIVVNDGSLDDTGRLLSLIKEPNLKVIHHASNRGKGAAFISGLTNASGEFVLIQDADLEYDPADYSKMMDAILRSESDAMVLGIRFIKGYHGLFLHRLGNGALTTFLNLIFGSHLNDYATCYKLALRSVFNRLNLRSSGFDIDVEIVCSALKKGFNIIEVPVSYHPRSYKQGKKIRLNDAFWALFYMLKYRMER
jgi:glycosyltransferase involved in cell wall biosynthesis